MSDVEFKMDGLNAFVKTLKSNSAVARVGILQDPKLATIGSFQEFGTSTIPVRSFLRVPISDHLASKMENSADFTVGDLTAVIKTSSLDPWLQIIGKMGMEISKESFDNAGFGQWKQDKSQIEHHSPLKKTGALQDSISFDIKEK